MNAGKPRKPLQRKTPLKSTSQLSRTPLARAGAGRSTVSPAPARHNRIAGQSKRRAKDARTYTAGKAEFLAANPICQRCNAKPATDLHHRANRSQSAAAFLDPDNWVALCREDHDWVGSNRLAAFAEGWAVPGWEYRKGLAA